jgi:hypothetical protein
MNARLILLAAGMAVLGSHLAPAAEERLKLSFQPHAAFFSKETHQPKAVDPQVFVAAPGAAPGVSPQNILYAAGLRPAFVDDPPTAPLFAADGKPLGFALDSWLKARGSVIITPRSPGGAHLEMSFDGLIPNGTYSLFENHFDQKPIGFTPLDGAGDANSFRAQADGRADVAVDAPSMPTSANAVLLVYHSDGQTHGAERGIIGVTAHHQLIAKIP